MPLTTVRAGETWRFKHPVDVASYGATATVTRITTSVDRPHPGVIHHDWIDLVTANGTRLQWAPGTLRAKAARLAA